MHDQFVQTEKVLTVRGSKLVDSNSKGQTQENIIFKIYLTHKGIYVLKSDLYPSMG